MQDNVAPLQQHPEYYLCVPGSRPTLFFATVPTERADQGVQAEIIVADPEELENGFLPDNSISVNGVQPMRVFSPSSFTRMVCRVFCFYRFQTCVDHTLSRLKSLQMSGR